MPAAIAGGCGYRVWIVSVQRGAYREVDFQSGAAALHIEDQIGAKRCSHRPNKAIVSKEEMVDRIRAAVDARTDPNFVIMARTDALAVEGLEAAIDRARAYVEAGADMLFPEAITELAMYRQFADAVQVPILANITEFGATPLFTTDELRSANVAMALYPLSAFRAMNRAAEKVYNVLRQEGTQKSVIDIMQTRNELYESINYYQFEEKLDALYSKKVTVVGRIRHSRHPAINLYPTYYKMTRTT